MRKMRDSVLIVWILVVGLGVAFSAGVILERPSKAKETEARRRSLAERLPHRWERAEHYPAGSSTEASALPVPTTAGAMDDAVDPFRPLLLKRDPLSGRWRRETEPGEGQPGAPSIPSDASELEIIQVERAPFRVQLIGVVGQAPNWKGVFRIELTQEQRIGTEGAQWSDLQVEVGSIRTEIDRAALARGERAGHGAVANLRDLATGETVVVRSNAPTYNGPWQVVARLGSQTSAPTQVGVRFAFAADSPDIHVVAIASAGQVVELSVTGSAGQPSRSLRFTQSAAAGETKAYALTESDGPVSPSPATPAEASSADDRQALMSLVSLE